MQRHCHIRQTAISHRGVCRAARWPEICGADCRTAPHGPAPSVSQQQANDNGRQQRTRQPCDATAADEGGRDGAIVGVMIRDDRTNLASGQCPPDPGAPVPSHQLASHRRARPRKEGGCRWWRMRAGLCTLQSSVYHPAMGERRRVVVALCLVLFFLGTVTAASSSDLVHANLTGNQVHGESIDRSAPGIPDPDGAEWLSARSDVGPAVSISGRCVPLGFVESHTLAPVDGCVRVVDQFRRVRLSLTEPHAVESRGPPVRSLAE